MKRKKRGNILLPLFLFGLTLNFVIDFTNFTFNIKSEVCIKKYHTEDII